MTHILVYTKLIDQYKLYLGIFNETQILRIIVHDASNIENTNCMCPPTRQTVTLTPPSGTESEKYKK